MDIVAAYEQVGTYRGAADLRGTTHKLVFFVAGPYGNILPSIRAGCNAG
jgi:hypothetical protein